MFDARLVNRVSSIGFKWRSRGPGWDRLADSDVRDQTRLTEYFSAFEFPVLTGSIPDDASSALLVLDAAFLEADMLI